MFYNKAQLVAEVEKVREVAKQLRKKLICQEGRNEREKRESGMKGRKERNR